MIIPNSPFRVTALRYHVQQHDRKGEDVRPPRLLTGPAITAVWCLVAILFLATAIACFAPIPRTDSGLAIVTIPDGQQSASITIAIILPPDTQRHLRAGQAVDLALGPDDVPATGTIIRIEPAPLTGSQLSQRLQAVGLTLPLQQGSATLAWVRLTSPVAGTRDQLSAGEAGQVRVVTGSQHAGTLLPLFGKLFKG